VYNIRAPAREDIMARLHLCLAVVWALLAIPTLLWWHDSVLWVALVSLYANAVGHLAAFQAARAERRVEQAEEARHGE
jgi:hypothetical protein